MKRLTLIAIAISSVFSALSVFAQAHVNMNNDIPGYPAPVFGPDGHTRLSGASSLAQLIGAPGYNQPESTLLPGSSVYTFRTGIAAGFVADSPGGDADVTFNSMPSTTTLATLEMVAWDNSSGLYPTWTQASVAWVNGLIYAGESGVWNQDGLTPTDPGPRMINSTDPNQRDRSFNIHPYVPEPGTAMLAGLGAAAMLILRRRKQ